MSDLMEVLTETSCGGGKIYVIGRKRAREERTFLGKRTEIGNFGHHEESTIRANESRG